jgi:hypothetical protein
MSSRTIKIAGAIAGIVVILGVLAIGAQYLSQIGAGANAQVIDAEDVPNAVVVGKEDYLTMRSLLDRYGQVTDLATKNQIMGDLRIIFNGLTNN